MRILDLHNSRRAMSAGLRGTTAAACVLLLVMISALVEAGAPVQSTVGAASGTDARWQPWLGCWELSNDAVQDPGEATPDQPLASANAPGAASGIRVCVTPVSAPSGVRMTTQVQGRPVLEEMLVADGTEQPIEDKTCRGSRRSEWSRNGQRLFSRADITCAGEPPHWVSHLATIVEGTWIDVQGITRDGYQGLRVRRYRPVGIEAFSPNRDSPPGRGLFSIDDVKEASAKVTPLVLQAALVESRARFPLNGRTMLDLDRAGVADEVIDLMVALSYPERFRINRLRTSGGSHDDLDLWGYAPFAYSYWGFNDYWYSEDVVIIGGGDEPAHPAGGGRVVNGRGYTRIEPVAAASAARGDSTASDSTSSTAPQSGDSGGVSSEGYSSGGSGGDSDRTAQPRPE